jgi:hypothetical protein
LSYWWWLLFVWFELFVCLIDWLIGD